MPNIASNESRSAKPLLSPGVVSGIMSCARAMVLNTTTPHRPGWEALFPVPDPPIDLPCLGLNIRAPPFPESLRRRPFTRPGPPRR